MPVSRTRLTAALLVLASTVASTASAQDKAAPGKSVSPGKSQTRTVWPDEGLRTWAPRPTTAAFRRAS